MRITTTLSTSMEMRFGPTENGDIPIDLSARPIPTGGRSPSDLVVTVSVIPHLMAVRVAWAASEVSEEELVVLTVPLE